MLEYKISSIQNASDNIKIFRLEPIKEKLEYKPGQFLMLHLLDHEQVSIDKRPYSIASDPGSPYIELCIKMVGGRFTSKLDLLKTGDKVVVEGPLGIMTYEGDRCVFICGGTGIAPIMSMVRDIVEKRKKGSFIVFYSAKKRDMITYYDELLELEKKNPSIKIVITLTRESPPEWEGKCGRLNDSMIREFVKEPGEYYWYMCGPMEMMASLKEYLAIVGADPKKVHIEGWG